MEIRKILVPSELDEFSAIVTSFAVKLAMQIDISEIVLLNVIIPAPDQTFLASDSAFAANGIMANRFNTVLLQKHQELAEKEAERFTTDKVAINPQVRFSNSKTNLNEYMQEFEAGLVVCGSHDEHSFLQVLFGSDTENLVRKVDYPLIILKEEPNSFEVNSVLVAIDINDEDYNNLSEIIAFAESVNARVQLLHVITDDSHSSDKAIKKLRKLAKKNKINHYDINVVNNNSLEDGIRSFARKNNPDIIAVLSQGKGRIHKLIFGSSTEKIIQETDKPVFVSKIG